MNRNKINFDEDQIKNLEKFTQSYMTFMSKMIDIIGKISNFLSRNPKLIYTIIAIFFIYQIVSYVMSIEPKGQYEIKTSTGISYNTDRFDIKNGCVFFKKTSNNTETVICGDYVVIKN